MKDILEEFPPRPSSEMNPLRRVFLRALDSLVGDLRFASRYFARHQATVAIIVAVLALGTGANTMMFSLIQAEFRRPAPAVPDDPAHVRLWAQERPTTTTRWDLRPFTWPELQSLAQRSTIFTQVGAWTEDDLVLQAGDSAVARGINGQFVTPNYWSTVGVRLAAGQGFAPGTADSPDFTAIMSHAMATQLYGDPARAIGQKVLVNEVPLRLVGVAPARFQGAMKNMNAALWMPLGTRAAILRVPPRWMEQDAVLGAFARLAPGASRDQATALVAQVITASLPDSAARVGMARSAHVHTLYAPPPGDIGQNSVATFGVLMVTAVVVLLVSWMNVSSLMVAAAVGRRHEIAVRLSLGASRLRLLRQLVTESTALAIAGATLGLLVAWWALAAMGSAMGAGYDMTPDMGTFAFTFALAAGTGMLFGLSPALHAMRGVAGALRDAKVTSAGRARLQRGFVVGQIVLSQPLLVVLALLLWQLVTGYEPFAARTGERVIALGLGTMQTGAAGQREQAVDELVPRIAAHAGVAAAVPDAAGFDVRRIVAPDRVTRAAGDTVRTMVHLEGAAPGWFGIVDVPIVFGRDVALADSAAANRPIVIGSDLARALWGDVNPVGRVLASPSFRAGQDSISMTVVGVYDATAKLPEWAYGGPSGNVELRVFTAHGARWRRDRILVRTRGPAEPFLPELQSFMRQAAPSLPVTGVQTLAQADAEDYRFTLRMSGLALAGGLVALLLASLGLYGVVSLAVQQRTREIGIRIAVGAQPARVARAFLASGVRVGAIGLVIGLPVTVGAMAFGISRGVVNHEGLNPYATGAVIAAIMLIVASLATWLPARRAARVDPATTLRDD